MAGSTRKSSARKLHRFQESHLPVFKVRGTGLNAIAATFSFNSHLVGNKTALKFSKISSFFFFFKLTGRHYKTQITKIN